MQDKGKTNKGQDRERDRGETGVRQTRGKTGARQTRGETGARQGRDK